MKLGLRVEIKTDISVGLISMYMVFRTIRLNLATWRDTLAEKRGGPPHSNIWRLIRGGAGKGD